MDIQKISNKKVSDSVAEQIERMIESGKFETGEKLPSVRELCEMFGVGRSAVRDAITTLKGKGTVDVRRGEGTFICGFNSSSMFKSQVLLPGLKDIRELFQVRKMLETGMAELAAENCPKALIVEMEDILSEGHERGWGTDYRFHMAVAKAAGNDILIQLIDYISAAMKKAMSEFHRQIEKDEEVLRQIERQHQEILACIKLKDPERAKEEMMRHLSYVEELLKANILEKHI